MSGKELMIGDWVKTPKGFFKVTDIQDNDVIGTDYNNGEGVDSLFFNDEIEPIPLTAEVLEKNGFENIGDDIYQLEEKPCWFWVDFFKHTYGCEYDTSTYEYEDDEHRLKLYGIPSVHELQHSLKLCGIEKEIEL